MTHAEFKAWLRANNTRLRDYTPDQIARLGLACGFPIEIICPNVCDRIIHIQKLFAFWESDLSEKWMRVVDYDRGIEVQEAA